ncbi:hypothetical protein MPER_09484, partial [Moniliophthora perniciosa FA553]
FYICCLIFSPFPSATDVARPPLNDFSVELSSNHLLAFEFFQGFPHPPPTMLRYLLRSKSFLS